MNFLIVKKIIIETQKFKMLLIYYLSMIGILLYYIKSKMKKKNDLKVFLLLTNDNLF